MKNTSILFTCCLLNLLSTQSTFASCEDGQSIAEQTAMALASKYWSDCKIITSYQTMQWDAQSREGWDVKIRCGDSPLRSIYVVLTEQEDAVCTVQNEKLKPLSGKYCGLTGTYGGGEGEADWNFNSNNQINVGTMSEDELVKLPKLIEIQLNALNKTESEGDILAVVKNLKENSEGEEVYIKDFNFNNAEYTDAVFYPGGNPVGVIFKKLTAEIVAFNSDGDITCADNLTPLPERPTFEPTPQTKMVDEAIEMLRPLAGSGIDLEKVAPTESVKKALLALAIQVGYVETEEELSWVGTKLEAWDGDSTNFGETTAIGAVEFIGATYNEDRGQYELKIGSENQIKAQKAVELLQQAGTLFGVVPLGSIQCGFTFAALAVIEPITGRIFIIKREISGC